MLLLCIGICIPLAVYGAASANDLPADDDATSPVTVSIAAESDEELEKTSSSAEGALSEEPDTSDAVTELQTVGQVNDEPDELLTPDDELFEGEAADEPAAEPEPVLFNVTVSFYDREALYCSTEATTLRQLLASNGIWLTENEHPSVGLDELLEYDSWISVDKTEYGTVTETEYIPFETELVNVTSIPRGSYQTVTAGQAGTRDTVYTVEYLNGVEVSRTKEYDYISSSPVNEVCYYGTGGTFTAPDGAVYSYSYCKNVRATYYNIYGTTASGMATGPNVVATDPSVFPLGTQLYVMNDTFDLGVKTAADTGGAVRGDFIDIWMDASCPYYEQFAAQGVWSMTVYVLD